MLASQSMSAFVATFVISAGASAQWDAKVLHPSGTWDSVLQSVTGAQQVGHIIDRRAGIIRAAAWSGTPESAAMLDSAGTTSSRAFGTDGTSTVGYGVIGGYSHAVIWDQSGLVDLQPPEYTISQANGTSGQIQGGWVSKGGPAHAAMWRGDAASFVDLHPNVPEAKLSQVYGVGGDQLVGTVQYGALFALSNASLWSATTGEFTNLHPSEMMTSSAYCTDGVRQAGVVSYIEIHAALWSGSASSVVDLHPDGMVRSVVFGISGDYQVGRVDVPGPNEKRAALWTGTAESYVSLHDFLPPRFDNSEATCIFEAGGVVYVGGWAIDNGTAALHEAVLWTLGESCAADCDGSGSLDVFDFLCFQDAFVRGDTKACDCNTATGGGVCDIFDFLCFQDGFVAGCP